MFRPEDPFPLLSLPYPEAKLHSRAVDAWLGLRVPEVEAGLGRPPEGQETWVSKGPDVFLTPYTELRQWLHLLAPAPGATVVDLGAGYGRLGFVLHRHYPGVRFLGFELVPERVREGAAGLARFGAEHARLECADLSAPTFFPPPADAYFIYDFGVKAAIAKVLDDLRVLARERPLTVVGRGRAVRDEAERRHPWLSQVVPPRHFDHFSIYASG